MNWQLFLKEEKLKIAATCIVAAFYAFFWVNGPLDWNEAGHNKIEVTPYSNPKLVDTKQGESVVNENVAKKHESVKQFDILYDPITSAQKNKELVANMQAHITALYPERKWELHQGSTCNYLISTTGSTLYYIESKQLEMSPLGYAGPINMGVVLNEDGKILAAFHVESEETESYLWRIENHEFYDQLNNISPTNHREIDAVSGATITTKSMAQTVELIVNQFKPVLIDDLAVSDLESEFSLQAILSNSWILHILVIAAMFLYGFQKRLKKSKNAIVVISILSVVYIGFYLNNSFTYLSFLHPFLGASVSSMIGIYALFSLLGAIWGKNTYCKYVCPFGNAQRLVLHFAPSKYSSKFPLSNKYINRIRTGLMLALMFGVLCGFRFLGNFELFPDFFAFNLLSVWFFISLATVFITIKYPMIWCRLLCPTGSILDHISDVVNLKWKKA